VGTGSGLPAPGPCHPEERDEGSALYATASRSFARMINAVTCRRALERSGKPQDKGVPPLALPPQLLVNAGIRPG
jgi:hypothetical protein